MKRVRSIYKNLLKKYGQQGWWPLLDLEEKDPKSRGYHPGKYDYPKNGAQRFEVCCGAILTQNTAWKNVELPLLYSGIPVKERKQRALDVLEKVGLQERAEHNPSELSGGEMQRVAIARALAMKPEAMTIITRNKMGTIYHTSFPPATNARLWRAGLCPP